jgi:RNase H-like domain found in reverse transcriptase
MQMHEGRLRPVSFASRATSKSESQLCSAQLELLALVYGVNKFHEYLQMSEVELQTDCSAVKQIFEK